MIVRHGADAEREAIKLANLMPDHDARERQVEWLRVWTATVLLRAQVGRGIARQRHRRAKAVD
ncbi:MAG: hypothetical protein WA417_20130 [Stellaceae bacterium]